MSTSTIGVFGGAFDPVHLDHIAMGQKLLDRHICHKILYIPSPTRLDKTPVAPAAHRLAMLHAACAANPQMAVSDLEIRLGYRGTYALLHSLQNQYGMTDFKLIVGADTYPHIPNWIKGERLLREFELIIFARQGYPLPELNAHLQKGYKGLAVINDFHGTWASSSLRPQLWRNPQASQALPVGVWAHIKAHQLYAPKSNITD